MRKKRQKQSQQFYSFDWRNFLETIGVVAVIAVLIRMYFCTPLQMGNSDMMPNLRSGDLVLAMVLPYGLRLPFTDKKIFSRLPQRGEVVVVQHPVLHNAIILRAVGLPGDRVEIRENQLWINEKAVESKRLSSEITTEKVGDFTYPIHSLESDSNFGPSIVPPGHLFLLGDNRSEALDSREFGTVPSQLLTGGIRFVLFSFKNWQEGGRSILLKRSLRPMVH